MRDYSASKREAIAVDNIAKHYSQGGKTGSSVRTESALANVWAFSFSCLQGILGNLGRG